MKIIICALLFVAANAKQFQVKQNETVCAMLEISGNVELKAMDGNVTLNQTYTLDFADATYIEDSDCNTIKLNFSGNAQVWFKKTGDQVQPIAASVISKLYPEETNKGQVTFTAPAVGNFMSNQSFMCKSSLEHKFSTSDNTSLEYTLTATTMNLEVQFGDITNSTFSGDKVDCDQDKTTATTPTTVTTGTPSTLPPAPEKFSANVTNGNITCIMIEGAFTVAVTVEDPVKKENVTKYLNVPTNAVASGNCSVNGTLQSMTLTFEKSWNLGFMFSMSSGDDASISISEISVTYDTSVFGGAKAIKTVTEPKTEFLKSGANGYYLCNSNSTIVQAQNVQVTSTNLQYKAFNKDNKPISDGNVSECPADEETSSVVPIAVGAALAGLVVIVLIAYLIGRRRARKTGYESV